MALVVAWPWVATPWSELWVYGSSFENFLVAVVIPKEENLKQQTAQQHNLPNATSMDFKVSMGLAASFFSWRVFTVVPEAYPMTSAGVELPAAGNGDAKKENCVLSENSPHQLRKGGHIGA
eukprot:1143655-Pelagomonas_calceolata.AAC.21